MSEHSLNEQDPFALIKAANPFPTGGSSTEAAATPQPKQSRMALFEEITMTTATTPTTAAATPLAETKPANVVELRSGFEAERSRQPRFRWRLPHLVPAFASLVVLAGLVAIIGLGVFGNPPSAVATVSEAASRAAAFNSGAASIVMDIVTIDGEEVNEGATFDYRYEFGNWELIWSLNGTEMGSDEFTQIHVQGAAYTRQGSSEAFTQVPYEPGFGLIELFGINPEAINAESAIPLIETAADFGEVTPEGAAPGVTVYRGTLDSLILATMEPGEVPPGLSFLTGENQDQLPPTLDIEVTIVDDVLRSTVVRLDGMSPRGLVQGTITSDFHSLGEPQNIQRPTNVEQMEIPVDAIDVLNDEFFAVMGDLHERRPGLCKNKEPGDFLTSGSPEEIAETRQKIESYLQCFVDAGEPAAAEVIRPTFPQVFVDSAGAEALAKEQAKDVAIMAEVLERRPGLCENRLPIGVAYDVGSEGAAQMRADMAAYIQCFDDAGEPGAADAMRRTLDTVSG